MTRLIISRIRSDVAVGLLAVVVLLTWPDQILGLVCDMFLGWVK